MCASGMILIQLYNNTKTWQKYIINRKPPMLIKYLKFQTKIYNQRKISITDRGNWSSKPNTKTIFNKCMAFNVEECSLLKRELDYNNRKIPWKIMSHDYTKYLEHLIDNENWRGIHAQCNITMKVTEFATNNFYEAMI